MALLIAALLCKTRALVNLISPTCDKIISCHDAAILKLLGELDSFTSLHFRGKENFYF